MADAKKTRKKKDAEETVEPVEETSAVAEETEAAVPVDEVVEPAVAEPVAAEAPAAEADETASEAPVADEPVADEPVADEPVAEEPVAEEPVAEEPIAEAPVAEEPAEAAEPVAEEPVAAADEPVAEPVPAEEPAVEEASAEEPAAGADEPAQAAAPAEEAAAAAPPKPAKKRLARALRHKHSKPKREPVATRKPITRLPKPESELGRRQERRGVVVSDKGDKTIVVKVSLTRAHPKYKKVVRRTRKFHAHDETNSAAIGDTVRIVETRPLSKTKNWRLAEIVERAR